MFYPGFAVGIDDDFSRDAGDVPPPWELVTVRQGTQGPNGNRWGDTSRSAVEPGRARLDSDGNVDAGLRRRRLQGDALHAVRPRARYAGNRRPPNIYTANSATFAVESAGTFTVMASGFPAPTFTRSGAFPSGVNFDTTTGILSGTPGAGTGAYPLTIGAVNGVLPNASQSFTLQ